MADDIILHHFDASPFSEKIRVIFGLKKVTWKSVLISRIMPRPDLMPLTGGYRRTPVMQIGADIFCDTQIIIAELERRFPNPTLLPDRNEGLPWLVGLWSDRVFFQNTVNLVFGKLGDSVPEEFIADRAKLRGAPFDVAAMRAALPHWRDQFRSHCDRIDAQLTGRSWLLGDFSLADVNAYMNVWYARTNLADESERLLAEFPALVAWEKRIKILGHGNRTEMSKQDALKIGTEAKPRSTVAADPHDPAGLMPGDRVTVTPDDYGKVGVAGMIVSLSAQHIAIRRNDPLAGDIVVHFPRTGFAVTKG
ncbi:MAG: glutathione S-transferase family protein [Rhizobiales bacterium]|nr:glutathione S-transferase family protein [Hyphomicrobiales bacterium]